MKKLSLLNLLMLLSCSLVMISCSDDDDAATPVVVEEDYSDVINNIANNVIVNTYNDLDSKAEALLSAVQTLRTTVNDATLVAAQEAWKATRVPWESSEGFLFGPVDTKGIDPSLDSWPVNQVDLENVLASGDEIDFDYVNALEGTLKGFHTIEFLLWGGDGNKTAADLTDREFDYLVATTEVLAADAKELANSWKTGGDNYVNNLLTAGDAGNNVYISQKAALEEYVGGLVGICDEVGNGKINDPLEQEDLSLEESQFSDNSKTDFSNNIISIQNVYVGINGNGLSSIVSSSNSGLDAQIKSEIQNAIEEILNIPGTFTEAIPASSPTRADAEAAQAAVRTLKETLESQLQPLISNL